MFSIKVTHLTFFICLFLSLNIKSQTINWANDIAPILYKNCVSCHRDGGIGHFSLIGYDNAVSHRDAIADQTLSKQMPPWKADPTYRHFRSENLLSEIEIQKIQEWASGNAEAGDLSQAPATPYFSDESTLGMPDLVLNTPLFTNTATEDEYRCFVIPSNLVQFAYLRGMEIIPSNHEVVHHVLIYQDDTGAAQALDAQTPEEGYVHFGSSGVNGATLVGGWAPGARAELFPPNMGIKLKPNADLIVQIHYPAGSEGMSSSAKVNFFFTPNNTGIRELYSAPALNHSPLSLENFPLNIPVNTVKTYHAKYKINQKGTFLSVAPHMHLIGQSMTCFAELPSGDTIPLARINDWDFHWQGSYVFQKAQPLPAGTTLHAYATYDNTINNDQNPSNPPQNVVQGEATTDEMLVVYFTFMGYNAGDENLILDSTLLSTPVQFVPENKIFSNFNLSPNPADEFLFVEYDIAEKSDLETEILDINGKLVQVLGSKTNLTIGHYNEKIMVTGLTQGVYFLKLKTKDAVVTKKFLIQRK
jgi:hypothetical protein